MNRYTVFHFFPYKVADLSGTAVLHTVQVGFGLDMSFMNFPFSPGYIFTICQELAEMRSAYRELGKEVLMDYSTVSISKLS